jgi:hypothetical protein
LDDFEIVQNCARKIVRAGKFTTNWESFLRENIFPVHGIVVGQESIGRDYGICVGDFPAILFRIQESFALKFSNTFSQKYFKS